ncbi:hypothetical protein P5W04_10315 [Mycobacteroides abscessus subsp. abscessus]|uniref:hypothetical protein n=1 Tax=Mycobacteroides abscessus TaxID=36809 RepID=UPI000E697EC4|nr:hypothetical protein [Mycobacteroides abscessus]MBN7484550.1 hypothetical protein [Mycobacteroides abscessus subsp. abscessus]MDO3240508.1 hypothetical protein [Mycobacteroides abscessus subsp. abscessus]RIT75003.1 hypothetical protein D2E77_01590 [Mycobacteroides abscessus]
MTSAAPLTVTEHIDALGSLVADVTRDVESLTATLSRLIPDQRSVHDAMYEVRVRVCDLQTAVAELAYVADDERVSQVITAIEPVTPRHPADLPF